MSEGFFPGSRQPLAPPGGLPEAVRLPEGKVYDVGTGKVELLTVGQVAKALNRTPTLIRRWESDGVIPRATFVKPGAGGDVRGKRRLYSKAQLEAMVKIAAEERILHDKTRRIGSTQFSTKVFEAFRALAGAK